MQNALVFIFFLSGIAALAFETLWFRLAGLSLGNSVWSASLVLAAFMGGLTLGNGLVARLHARIARPLRLYAVLEIVIGVAGFAVVALLRKSRATDDYKVDPATGDVYDPEGEVIGNLNDPSG